MLYKLECSLTFFLLLSLFEIQENNTNEEIEEEEGPNENKDDEKVCIDRTCIKFGSLVNSC